MIRWYVCVLLLLLAVAGAYAQPAPPAPPADPSTRLSQIDDLYYDGKYAEALEGYEQFLKDYPDAEGRDRVMLQLGQTYGKLARDAEARRTYLELIDAAPDGSYVVSAVQLMASLYAQRYQHPQAIQWCQQIMTKYPATRAADIAAYLVPTYLYAQGKTTDAVKAYNAFIENYPSSIFRSSAFSSLISLYIMQKQFDAAEQLLLSNIGTGPQDADLLEQLAQVYQKRGRLKEALRLYQEALAQNPNNTSILEKIGEIYVEQGDKQRAVTEWQRIVQRNPNQYYQHQRLADIYKQHRFYDQAIAAYETAIGLQPRTSYLYTQLADVYRIQNELPRAIETYVRALVILAPTYGGRSRIYTSLAELYPPEQSAQAFLEAEAHVQALLDNPPSPTPGQTASSPVNLMLALAELAFHRGDYQRALIHYQTLAGVYSDQGQALQKAAEQLERTGEMLSAARFYEQIIQIFPTGALVLKARLKASQAYAAEGVWERALVILQSAPMNDVPALLLRAEIQLRHLHDVPGAVATYALVEQFARSGGYHSQLKLGQAEAMILQGEDPAPLLTPLLKVAPRYALQAQLLLAHALFFAGEFEPALESYQKVIDKDLGSEWANDALAHMALIRGNGDFFYQPLGLYAQGLQYECLGDLQAAIASYMSILEKFPKAGIWGQAHMKLAQIHTEQGETDRAVILYETLISAEDALTPEAMFRLAEVYFHSDGERAKQTYTQLLDTYPQSIYAAEARGRLRVLLNSERKDES